MLQQLCFVESSFCFVLHQPQSEKTWYDIWCLISHLHLGPKRMSVLLLSFTNFLLSPISPVLYLFFSPSLPFLSLSLSLSLFTIAPSPSSSCRYLTPCVKSEYYVTKWVEDVNKNTEGPYIRYKTPDCIIPVPYPSVSLLSCFFPSPNIIFQRWELSVRVWRVLFRCICFFLIC